MRKRKEFTQPRFILAEGHEDAAFIRAFIKARDLQAFDVSPNPDIGSVRGNSGSESAVIACEPLTGFTAVSKVVILADNDDDPAASFRFVCDQIEKARREGNLGRNWGQAAEPCRRAAGDPTVSIWMWPEANQPGCLETLLWRVIETKYPNETACVVAACQCAGADGWPVSKMDKARVRCFLSLVCRINPAIVLANLWRDAPELIPLDRVEFDSIEKFLTAI